MRQLLQWARRSPDAANAIFITVLGGVLVASMVLSNGNSPGERYDAWAYLILGMALAPLYFRRHHPIPVLVAVTAAIDLWYGSGYTGEAVNFPLLISLFTAGYTGSRRRTIILAPIMAANIVGAFILFDGPTSVIPAAVGWSMASLLLGDALRSNKELVADYEERAALAEADRELVVERRIAAERLRIARELHDLMAHTITTMTVQAGVAADAIDDDPEVVRESLQTIRAAGREAVREVKATVSLLRHDGDRARRSPMPGLAQVPALIERAGAAGLQVTVAEIGERRPLPAVIELTAYRVVQESLTNVVRHSGTAAAVVQLRYQPDAFEVEVTDEGAPAARNGHVTGTAGYGLLGMAERAAAVGGTVEHGTRPGGGYRVMARLPLGSRAWRSP